MRYKLLLTGLASTFAVVACGEKTETVEVPPPPDAEEPYAEPVTPPAHTDVATRPELKPEKNAQIDYAAIDELGNAADAERGKVDNVTSSASEEAKSAIKKIATNTVDDLNSAEEPDDPFGSLVGDAVKGKRLYAQCQACHSVAEGQNRVGPSLFGVVGREAGAVDRFNYSQAITESAVVWTEDALFGYLEDPQDYLPGTRMFYPGVAKPQDRVDIIAYLKSLTE